MGDSVNEINENSQYPKHTWSFRAGNPTDTHLPPFHRQGALRLGSSAEQRLHGLLPTRSEGNHDESRTPQPKTTGRPRVHQRGHLGRSTSSLMKSCAWRRRPRLWWPRSVPAEMFRFVGKYLQVPTMCAPGADRERHVCGACAKEGVKGRAGSGFHRSAKICAHAVFFCLLSTSAICPALYACARRGIHGPVSCTPCRLLAP